jgi:protein CpxP
LRGWDGKILGVTGTFLSNRRLYRKMDVAGELAAGSVERKRVEIMKNVMKIKMFRAAAVLVCGAGLVASAAMAQQQDAPPPPADGQQQGPPPGGHRGFDPERRVEMMQRQLNLTADQTTQVRAIFADGRAKMEALRGNTSLAPADRRAQGEALRQDEHAKVEAVLTPDQKTKFDAMEARMRERRHDGQEGGAPPPPPPPAPQQ